MFRMIARIIKASVCVILFSRQHQQITQTSSNNDQMVNIITATCRYFVPDSFFFRLNTCPNVSYFHEVQISSQEVLW